MWSWSSCFPSLNLSFFACETGIAEFIVLLELNKACQSALQGSWHMLKAQMLRMGSGVSKQKLMDKAIKLNVAYFFKCAAQILIFQSEPGTSITILILLGSWLADICPTRQRLMYDINSNPHLSSACFGPDTILRALHELPWGILKRTLRGKASTVLLLSPLDSWGKRHREVKWFAIRSQS